MKKILILAMIAGLIACENQKNEFPDYDYISGFFPYQYPVRTLVLGDYIFPNENDNNHKFLISVALGGTYDNKSDRVFNIELAPSLCDSVKFSDEDTIRLMPESYYTLSSNEIIIPKGKFNGGIEVQLSEAFFDDPIAIKLGYVIPLRIVDAENIDSVLHGNPAKTNPDPRVSGDWLVRPKDFTMFAVKFINPYHANYLHRGVSVVRNEFSEIIETTIYSNRYVERNEIWSLITTGKNTVSVTGSLHSELITGSLKMNLNFTDETNCTISQDTSSVYLISGSGIFAKDADEWGNKKRNAIFINYQVVSGSNTYYATDTLAVRDRDVVMQVYSPVVF